MMFIWIFTELFIIPSVFAAENDLIVDFEATPLFNEANFLPGSEVSRWVKVQNNTSDNKSIIVEAINKNDFNGLANVFEIGIYEGGVKRYATTTLAEFFNAGEIFLSNISSGGAKTQYDFLVKFVSEANNSYQEKSLSFDILIGFKGDNGVSEGVAENGGGNNSNNGGGGGGILSGLVIQNEASVDVTDVTATIVWNTSYKSTSRVIYGLASGVFDFGLPPNYGYSFSTDEFNTPANPNGVTLHSVVLTGLTPVATYYFRTISHASPDTISKEVSFITMKKSVLNSNSDSINSDSNIIIKSNDKFLMENSAETNNAIQTQNLIINPVIKNKQTEDINNKSVATDSGISQNIDSNNTNNNNLNNNDNVNLLTATLFGLNMNIWWLFFILILLFIIYFIYKRYKTKQ